MALGRWQMYAVMLAAVLSLGSGAQAQDSEPQPLTIHFFYSPTCPHCHPVRDLLQRLQAQHPQLAASEHNLAEPENIELMIAYYTRYEVPKAQWGGTLALFVGDRWWNDGDEILAELGPAVKTMTAAPPAPQPGAGDKALQALFGNLGVLTVAGAGLLDGINPCALATLVFLISYLSFTERRPRQVLATGLLFAAGIFLAYLGLGLGALGMLHKLAGVSVASKLLYPAMAAGTAVLAGYSFRDFLRARGGAVSTMALKLPRGLTRAAHSLIRSWLGGSTFLAFAFLAGAAIAILELFCTGQIYLPTLMYIWSTASLRGRTLQFLVLYVAMFTLPILVLTLLAYAGVKSQRLADWAQQQTATVKLGMTLLFLVLTAHLAVVSLRIL